MRHLALLALALFIPQEKNEAEELFKKMEEKFSKAKTVFLKFEGTLEPQGIRMTGELHMGEGTRTRCEVEAKKDSEKDSTSIISDGKSIQLLGRGNPISQTFDAPESFGRLMRIGAARAGILVSMEFAGGQTKAGQDPKTAIVASGFKLGASEKVGDRESQSIEYTLSKEGDLDASVTVWIDPETHLPLKRILKKGTKTLTENYPKITLDEKIDPAKFELPKSEK